MKQYHKLIWSRLLPNGKVFDLVDTDSRAYLKFIDGQEEIKLSSDTIINSYTLTKRLSHLTEQYPKQLIEDYIKLGYSVGGFLLYPSYRVNKKMTINGAKGTNAKIRDRFDLTLECTRLYYLGQQSPLFDTFNRYKNFFDLFKDLNGYVDFFYLNDLLNQDGSIKFFLSFNGFHGFHEDGFPKDFDQYKQYMERSFETINTYFSDLLYITYVPIRAADPPMNNFSFWPEFIFAMISSA